MPLLVAMSSLQGQCQRDAFAALAALPIDGIQLTPGNLPSPAFRAQVEAYRGSVRAHHTFSFSHYRAQLYTDGERVPRLPADWSIHPPPARPPFTFARWLEAARAVDALCEVMYPGYLLASECELREAMAVGLRLAVDVSHLNILRTRAGVSARTVAELLDYERIDEIHVSHNEGQRDSHRPLCPGTPWLDWARARLRHGAHVVFESRMHGHEDRWGAQLELLQ